MYLRFYEVSAVKQFIDAIAAADMSAINVCFVASVPNSHKDGDVYRYPYVILSQFFLFFTPPPSCEVCLCLSSSSCITLCLSLSQPPTTSKYPLRPLIIDIITQPFKIHSATSQPYMSDVRAI